MTHGVSGIDWKHYKHPLPENVYDVYMKNWRGVLLGNLSSPVSTALVSALLQELPGTICSQRK
jgi:hypothetical protein